MKNVTPSPLETLVYTPSFFVEIILHKDFGKNYLFEQNKKKLMIIFLVPLAEYFEPILGQFSKSVFWFLIICAVRALFEITRVEVNRRKKKKIHSYSSGIPLAIWHLITKNESITRTIFEPALIAIISIVFIITEYDILFGYALATCAFSLYVKEQFYIRRLNTITQSTEDAKLSQEAIKKNQPLPDYNNIQEDQQRPNIQEAMKSFWEVLRNFKFGG